MTRPSMTQPPTAPTRAVYHALRWAHADRVLIGACGIRCCDRFGGPLQVGFGLVTAVAFFTRPTILAFGFPVGAFMLVDQMRILDRGGIVPGLAKGESWAGAAALTACLLS